MMREAETLTPSEVVQAAGEGRVQPRRNPPTQTPPPRSPLDELVGNNPATAWLSLLMRYYGPLAFSFISWFVMWQYAVVPQLDKSRVDWEKQVQAASLLNEATKRLERIEQNRGNP